MKKTALLNSKLSRLVATLGHGDMVLVADAGMPAPHGTGVEIIDLALTPGVPDLATTVRVLLSEMQVESHVMASETLARNDAWLSSEWMREIGSCQVVSHEELKRMSHRARAVVRTGECTPYANLMLVAGVTF
ncbi:D-ribose pyranase [Trinickia caryophylli]|uniref:D-ribose pyranase n=1 Tax=Trinickia caryophylli TaxID=28094 RepID=A0A1X7CK08_TRICW|nr:D-ribose pyranase [Trinickia caryophylli]PMS09100.1 D-ribose pyranase [Trinickia caryophylli]TRX19976.1 D-ribose pyranase [Trinickia caryophylli]WQE12684.1 D-ribose pyranase [Trinickia caryophylli]SME97871.1 D-ribose pyranase [Trinickia caryophylli]GLU30390.1 D-ribose pyranase [Trinickia caryophylli]